jgi:long-chain acyl-CoA synthetase
MTETSGTIVLHRNGDVKPESAGTALPGCEIRISEAGEIQAKCPGLLVGYYNKPEAYQRIMTSDGWLHTGDGGYLDEQGHLVVLDRLEDMMTLQNGAKFSPQYLESKIRISRFVKEVILFGEGMPFISALICIDYNVVGTWAEKRNISYTSYADLSQKDEIYELIRLELKNINRTLREEWRVKTYALLVKDLDPDDAELTRVRKLRRGYVSKVYKALSDALYGGIQEVEMIVKTSYRDGRTKNEKRLVKIETIEED